MKSKRNVLIAFVLICCLCLSIGYAALTDTLYVDGKASVNVVSDDDKTEDPTAPDTPWEEAFNEDVYFKNSSSTAAVIGDDTDGDANDLLTITVPDGAITPTNRTVTYTVDIMNDSSDYDAQVTLKTPADTTNFTYNIKWTDNTTGAKTIDCNGSANVTITITLKTTPTADITNEAFSVTFNAEAVATK